MTRITRDDEINHTPIQAFAEAVLRKYNVEPEWKSQNLPHRDPEIINAIIREIQGWQER